jgi:formyl-CoA transferase
MQWDQLLERQMIVKLVNPLTGKASGASAPGFPIKFSRTPAAYDTPAPIPGEHTEDIFQRLAGLSQADFKRLKSAGVI